MVGHKSTIIIMPAYIMVSKYNTEICYNYNKITLLKKYIMAQSFNVPL